MSGTCWELLLPERPRAIVYRLEPPWTITPELVWDCMGFLLMEINYEITWTLFRPCLGSYFLRQTNWIMNVLHESDRLPNEIQIYARQLPANAGHTVKVVQFLACKNHLNPPWTLRVQTIFNLSKSINVFQRSMCWVCVSILM